LAACESESQRGGVPRARELAPAQRAAIVAELHRRYGNAFVAQQLAAAHGVAAADDPLPHKDAIQRAFGRHDVGSIRTQTGGEAAEAANALGATAYAAGEQIAFAKTPDLHTAAHEAAHVVQQRRGLAPGGLGAKDGSSEAAADRIADRVVAGVSAEDLLDGGERETGETTAAPIQAKTDDKPGKTQEHWDYVREYLPKILDAIELRLGRMPQPHARLKWATDGGKAIFKRIKTRAEIKPEHAMKSLWELVAPADLWAIVDNARRGPAATKLSVLQTKIGLAFEEAVLAALPRVGMRAVVQWDRAKGAPDPDEIVASSPLDILLGGVLADKSAVTWTPKKAGAPSDTEGDVFRNGTKLVKFEYAGAKDSNLWNWVKVTTPNATAEDLAATPLGAGVPPVGSDQAYRFAISPPYFGVPIEIARHIDEFKQHMTVETLAKVRGEAVQDSRPIVDMADREALRDSNVADDAARAQAPKAPGQLQLAQALGRVRMQIDDITEQLAPYKLTDGVDPARDFIERREKEAGDPKKLAPWAGALESQERLLHDAASELREVLESIKKQDLKPKDIRAHAPVRDLLLAYGNAGGRSHLHAEGSAALAEARRLRGRLALTQAEDQIKRARESALGVDAAQAGERAGDGTRQPHADEAAMRTQVLEAEDQMIRSKLARGEQVTDQEIADLHTDAAETDLRARLASLATSLADLKRQATALGLDKDTNGAKYSLGDACGIMLSKINDPPPTDLPPTDDRVKNRDKTDAYEGGWHVRLDKAKTKPRKERAAEFKSVSTEFNNFIKHAGLGEFFEKAQKEIAYEKLWKLIRNVAIQVGIAVITGEAIGVIGVAVRGIALAGEIGAEIRNASLAWEAASVLGQAAANTVVSGAMGGPMDARTFIENGLAIVLTSAAMKPFQGILAETGAVEGQIVSWGRTATKGGRLAAELVIETGVGIGAAGVAHAVTHGGNVGAQDAESWVTMGLSIAASKYVGKRTADMKNRLLVAAHELPRTAPKFDELAKRAGEVQKAADEISHRDPKKGKPPTPEEALSLMRKHHELVKAEHEIYAKEHPNDPRRKANESDMAADAQLLDASLQLAHLSPVIDGHVYEGSAKQIESAFKAADEIGVPTKREWISERDVWRVKSGDKTVEIHETQSWHEPPAELAAAHAVKETNFTGRAKKGTRKDITQKQVNPEAHEAAKLLGKDFKPQQDGSVTVTVGSETVKVTFRVGKPTDAVAKHTYKRGATDAEVVFSKQARPEDIQRAAAHELSEIRAMLAEKGLAKKDALVDGSERMQLSAHDHGRLGELDVLLRQAKAKPDSKDIATEMDGLLDHLGFDPKTIETNARARKIVGDKRMGEIVERMATREVPHEQQYKRGKEDSKETIANEFEQAIANAEKATKDGRVAINNVNDLVAQRARLEVRPDGVAANDPMWAKYQEYVAQRSNELRLYFELKRQGKKAGVKPEPMITWKKYQEVRNPFERGSNFQKKVGENIGDAKVSEVLGGGKKGETLENRFEIRDEVGVASEQHQARYRENPDERKTPQRPDHLAINKTELDAFWKGERKEPPTGVAFSDKKC
jgi:hypothetical protein